MNRASLLQSLRGRLVLSAFLVCLASLLAAGWLDAPERRAKLVLTFPPALRFLAQEPYQDALVLALFTLVLLALLWFVSAWTLRPLTRAVEEASQVGPARPDSRISENRLPAELRPLARAMNGALDRLAEALRAEQRFVGNAAHELRTPLAVLDLRLRRASSTGQTDWPAIEQDLASLKRRIDQLLRLARLEAGTAQLGPTNLARAAREAAASVLPLVHGQGRRLDIFLPDLLPVQGRASDLTDLVRNLLENALRHGRGTITLRAQPSGDHVRLAIEDEGPGVQETDRERVFERFASGASDGAGLGLAIVREVARAHGGSVRFADCGHCRVEFEMAKFDDSSVSEENEAKKLHLF